MPSVSLYSGTSVEISAPFTLVDTSKHRRYELCLSFAQTMIGDFFPTVNHPSAHSLFSNLGHIACCIDSHLDALDLEQKEKLLAEFPVFFEQLPENDQEEAFTWHLSALCIKIGTALYPPSAATMLFRFYTYCRNNNLLEPLLGFSLAVIRSGIHKSKAQTPRAILDCLHEEGKAAIEFLLLLLTKEKLIVPSSPRYIPLQSYLSRLECMLNIADDLSDHRKDKKRGTISLPINLSYFGVLGKRLLHTFALTIWSQPLLFPKHFIFFTGRYLSSEVGKSVNCTHARLPEGLERKTT